MSGSSRGKLCRQQRVGSGGPAAHGCGARGAKRLQQAKVRAGQAGRQAGAGGCFAACPTVSSAATRKRCLVPRIPPVGPRVRRRPTLRPATPGQGSQRSNCVTPSRRSPLRPAAAAAPRPHRLVIPRRPSWDETTTPDQLEEQERTSFYDWRRDLASLEQVPVQFCSRGPFGRGPG